MALGSLNTLDQSDNDAADLGRLLQPLRTGAALSGRFAVGFRHDAAGRLFVSPWRGPEPFFRDGGGTAPLRAEDDAGKARLEEFLTDAHDVPMAYGYPLYADDTGMLTPLLFCEVELRRDKGSVAIVKRAGAKPRLHQAPLLAAGYDRTAIEAATDAVEHGSYASLSDCLEHAFALIGWADPPFEDAALTALPDDPEPGWHNAAALFLRPAGPAHRKLLDELDRLEGLYTEAINPTALHLLAAPKTQRRASGAAAVAEIAPMTPDVPAVLDRCLQAPLSAVQAPPGTAKPALVLNLLASLVLDGRSVLVVGSSAQAIEHYAGRLQAVVEPDQQWIPRPGAPDMLDQLLQTVEQLQNAPASLAERRGGQPVPQALAELRDAMAALHRQVEAVRKAHRHLATRQRWRRTQRPEVSEAWLPLYEQKTRLEIDQAEVETLRDEARAPAGQRSRGGRRGDGDRAGLTAALEAVVAPLPTLLRDELLGPIHQAADDETALARLADAFDELARYAEWRRASVHEHQAVEALLGGPTGERLLQQFAVSQAGGARSARDWLKSHWQATLTANLAKTAERLGNSFDAMDRRALASGTQHAVGERQLGKVIGALTRQFPVWMVTADEAAMRLPLIDSLFDVVLIDDADRLAAPALLPLLIRGRRAVVMGSLADGPAERPGDAFSLCWTRQGVERYRLEAQARSHPQIVDYLADTFHGGRLEPMMDYAAMGETVPTPLQGLHWLEAADGTPAVAAAVELVAGWLKAPLVDPERPFTVGIVAADPFLLAALDGAIAGRGLDPVLGERLLIGPPDRFAGAIVDLLVLLPGIGADTLGPRAVSVAGNRALFHDAVAAARGGLYAIGEADACLKAGGFAAAMADACKGLAETRAAAGKDAPQSLRSRLAALLVRSGLAHWPVRGGFRVVGTLGQPYQVEMPGEAAEGDWVAPDDPDLIPVIVDPFDLRRGGEKLKARFDRLV